MKLDVPFIHQLWDTPDNFDGHWACGPTSMAMILAYYKFLRWKPVAIKKPFPHLSGYGWYLSNEFVHHGYHFDTRAQAPNGLFAGLYGTALDNHNGPGWVTGPYQTNNVSSAFGRGIKPIAEAYGLSMRIRVNTNGLTPSGLRQIVAQEIVNNRPVLVAGKVNGFGHVIVVTGFEGSTTETIRYWVNDPYGAQTTGQYTGQKGVLYSYNQIRPRWLCLFAKEERP